VTSTGGNVIAFATARGRCTSGTAAAGWVRLTGIAAVFVSVADAGVGEAVVGGDVCAAGSAAATMCGCDTGFAVTATTFAEGTGFLTAATIFFAGAGFFNAEATFLAGSLAFVCASFLAPGLGAGFFAAVLGTAGFMDLVAVVADLADGLPGKGNAVCADVGAANAVSNRAAIPPPSTPRQIPQAIQVSDRRGFAPSFYPPSETLTY
jgi:hypothetical protein